jgi:proline racemase
MLDAFHYMNGLYLEPEDIDRILTQELGIAYSGDSLDLINAQQDFEMLAGSRLQARTAMKQNLPLFYQFLLTEPVMTSLQQEGKKVNVSELVKMSFDVSGWPNQSSVIVDMTPADFQRQQQQAQQAQEAQQTQMAHEAQMEQVKTSNKAQLLDRASIDKAGEMFFKKVFEHDDQRATGIS